MGQSVEVVVSELHTAAARLADAGQRLQDGLSSVDAETTQLLGSGWRGQAASAYGPAWEQWHNGAELVVKSLQRMSELLTIAGKEYAKTDEHAAGALGSSMQGSGGSGRGGSGSQGASSSAVGQDASGYPAASGAGDMAQQMNLGQAMSPVAELAGQLTGQVTQALSQAGQTLAGLAKEAEQIASGLAEKAGDEKPSAEERRHEEANDGAAPSGDRSGPIGTAPVENRSTPPSDPTPRSR